MRGKVAKEVRRAFKSTGLDPVKDRAEYQKFKRIFKRQ